MLIEVTSDDGTCFAVASVDTCEVARFTIGDRSTSHAKVTMTLVRVPRDIGRQSGFADIFHREMEMFTFEAVCEGEIVPLRSVDYGSRLVRVHVGSTGDANRVTYAIGSRYLGEVCDGSCWHGSYETTWKRCEVVEVGGSKTEVTSG